MIKFETLKEKILSCSKTRKEYEDCALEYEIAYALILARQEANMTHFPSLQTIHKYSIAVNRAINLHVHP